MKKLIFQLLCNRFIGSIITFLFQNRIPSIKEKLTAYYVPLDYTNEIIRSMIFFGFYESAERRMINKYLPININVVELGSSLGIISSQIINKLNGNCSVIFLEANSYLISNIKKNIQRIQTFNNYKIENKAISYSNDTVVVLNISNNNTEVRLHSVPLNSISTITVPTCRLSDLYITKQNYTLVCDIEGAEIEILIYDSESLNHCSNMIIELHSSTFQKNEYQIDDLVQMIKSKGFSLVARDGNVFFFSKTMSID